MIGFVLRPGAQEALLATTDSTGRIESYHDASGKVLLRVNGDELSWADTFYHMVPINNNDVIHYYLFRDGRRIGVDSMWHDGFETDCESEGCIRFLDPKAKRTGFFNHQGRILIPAVYNMATPFRNGMSLVLRGGVLISKNDTEEGALERRQWKGGEQVLINMQNEVLADRVQADEQNIDWYSMRVNQPPADTAICSSIRGWGGRTYYYIDKKKQFEAWLRGSFLPAVRNAQSVRSLVAPAYFVQRGQAEWRSVAADSLPMIFKELGRPDYLLASVTLNVSITQVYPDVESIAVPARTFFNACGDYNSERFPAFELSVQRYNGQLVFIRMIGGYRLISASAR